MVTGTEKRGCLGTIVVGILGALLGGALFRFATGDEVSTFDDVDLGSIAVAFIGATLLLLVLEAIGRRSHRLLIAPPAPVLRRRSGLARSLLNAIRLCGRGGVASGHGRCRDRRSRPDARRVAGTANSSTIHPVDLLSTALSEVVEPVRHRPGRGRAGRRRLRQPGGRCSRSTSPARPGSPPASPSPSAATTVDTQCGSSQQATNLATSLVGLRRRRGRHRLRRRADEPRSRSGRTPPRLGLGRPGVQGLLRQLRVHLAVRGRRAHRRQVGRHPGRLRRVRPRLAAAGRPGLGRGPLRHPDRRGRRPRPRRGRQAHGHHPPRQPRRWPPRDHARGPRRPQGRSARPEGVHTAGYLLADLRRRRRRPR